MKSVILLLALLSPFSAFAHKVVGISDGDTLTLLVNKRPLKIRLANIDAPEKSQSFGEQSKRSLSDLCFGKEASYHAQDVDKYGRTIAVVICAGIEANRWQVERGMAWVYTRYNKDSSLRCIEKRARAERYGLWRDPSVLPPWEFRKQSRRS